MCVNECVLVMKAGRDSERDRLGVHCCALTNQRTQVIPALTTHTQGELLHDSTDYLLHVPLSLASNSTKKRFKQHTSPGCGGAQLKPPRWSAAAT